MRILPLFCILFLMISASEALSVSISMSDGASVYTESTTADMEDGDSLLSHSVLSMAGNQMNSFTTLDAKGNGSVEVDRSLSSTEFTSTESSVSETGGEIHAKFGINFDGNALSWMDNVTIRDANSAGFSLDHNGCSAFMTLTNGSMNANSMVKVTPGWNAWGLHSPADVKTKVAMNVSIG